MDPRVKAGGDGCGLLLTLRLHPLVLNAREESSVYPTGSSNLKPMLCKPSSACLPYSLSISLPRLGA